MSHSFKYLHSNPRDKQIEILKNNASASHKKHIYKAFGFVVGKGKIENEDDVDRIVERINALANYIAIEGKEEKAPNLPECFIISNESLKKIFPLIKKLRKELFTKDDAPFPNDIDEAIEWIKNEGKKEASSIHKSLLKNKKRIEEKEKDISKELKKITGLYWSLRTEEPKWLPFPLKIKGKFVGMEDCVAVWPRTPLAKLEEETRRFSEETNFSQLSLVMFVLTGIKPISLRYRFISEIKWTRLGMVKNVILNIYRPLNKREIEELYYRIKKEFKRKAKAFLTEKHLFLYDLVERRGGVKRKEKTKFWIEIKTECNKKYPNWFKGPDGPRMSYFRIMKRLQETSKL